MEDIAIIVGSPISDIGKGWITVCIAKASSDSIVLKIDPAYNVVEFTSTPENLELVSSDFKTYSELGLAVSPEQRILLGNTLLDFFQSIKKIDEKTNAGEIKIYTMSDASTFLANKIDSLLIKNNKQKCVIEIGGNINDPELACVSQAIHKLAQKAKLHVFLLTYFDYSEDSSHALKKHHVIQGIQKTREIFGSVERVYIRARQLPIEITPQMVSKAKREISERSLISEDKLIFAPNFSSVKDLQIYLLNENALALDKGSK